ncbi:hypothetical protein NRS6110_04282 [Bacillus subtilis]|uniref:hypothetical protein n=1 Tax=Bacillus subtilis group TaxID=653685 RepID=UPI00119E1DAD|nr:MULTISPECIES: hypothetical protein [Bacillus subtilis group]CAF1783397.1 hypothetical protein NRS6116_03969 [Bacillus subtilis]CAF1786710.1 hypothetical protein NRS6110_04282 [Bacillus subtilis]CAI6331380.1 hypothetical protein NRS6116_22870 [Bacillus subtilis]
MNKRKRKKLYLFFALITFIAIGSFGVHYVINMNGTTEVKKREVGKVSENIKKDPVSHYKEADVDTDKDPLPKDKTRSEKPETVAESFYKAYISYNYKKPLEYLDKSKKFMTDDFYEAERKKIRKQGQNKMISEYDSGVLYPDKTIEDEDKSSWQIIAIKNNIGQDKKKHKEQVCTWIDLEKTENHWLVSGVRDDGGCNE